MLEKMKEIIAEQLSVDAESVTEASSFKEDLGADSLDLFELVMALEDEYSVEIPAEELEKMSTVGDVMEYLKNHGVEDARRLRQGLRGRRDHHGRSHHSGCRADLRTGGFGLRASEKGAHQQRRKAGGRADSDQAARRWRADHSSKSGFGRKVRA